MVSAGAGSEGSLSFQRMFAPWTDAVVHLLVEMVVLE